MATLVSIAIGEADAYIGISVYNSGENYKNCYEFLLDDMPRSISEAPSTVKLEMKKEKIIAKVLSILPAMKLDEKGTEVG
jgi:hypothetical protein